MASESTQLRGGSAAAASTTTAPSGLAVTFSLLPALILFFCVEIWTEVSVLMGYALAPQWKILVYFGIIVTLILLYLPIGQVILAIKHKAVYYSDPARTTYIDKYGVSHPFERNWTHQFVDFLVTRLMATEPLVEIRSTVRERVTSEIKKEAVAAQMKNKKKQSPPAATGGGSKALSAHAVSLTVRDSTSEEDGET